MNAYGKRALENMLALASAAKESARKANDAAAVAASAFLSGKLPEEKFRFFANAAEEARSAEEAAWKSYHEASPKLRIIR